MRNTHIDIEYTIPSLGIINTQIYKPCAAACYTFLDKYGHIEKLKNINQLGVIKNTFNGTHHPRWEYVVLQIYLLNQLKKTEYKSGLSSNFPITLNEELIKMSACELIQIWILLLNSGHLPGTFASERGVLTYLKGNPKVLKTFSNGLPNSLKYDFNKTISNDNIYDIHKFIIAFLLKRHTEYPIKYNNTKIIDILIKCLELYILDTDNEKLLKLKFYFDRIRQLSYLFLDSHYTAFPINFNISQFVFNLEHHVKELFVPDSHLNYTLHSFDNLLTNDLYNSQDSIRELSTHSNHVHNILSSKKLDSLKNIKNIFEKDYEIFKPSIKEFDENYETLYLPFNLGELKPLNNSLVDKHFNMELEKELNILIGKRNLLTIQKSSNNNLMTITIVFKTNNYYNHILSIQKVTKKLISIKHQIMQSNDYVPTFLIDRIFDSAFKEIFLFILNKSNANHNKLFKFDELDIYPNILSINTKKDFENKRKRKLSNSDQYEENLTEIVARNNIFKNKSLISFSSLYWFDIRNPKKDIHEIDGVIINFKKSTIEIILVEAKNKKDNAVKSAKSQINETIEHINFYSEDELSVIENHNPKGAFCIIKISNIKSI